MDEELEQYLRELSQATVYGPGGEKIGRIARIYLSDRTGRPSFGAVTTGLLGMGEAFVPLDGVRTDHGRVDVRWTKDEVTSAPSVDADADLSPSDEKRLREYYGSSGFGGSVPQDPAADRPVHPRSPLHRGAATPVDDTGQLDPVTRGTSAAEAQRRNAPTGKVEALREHEARDRGTGDLERTIPGDAPVPEKQDSDLGLTGLEPDDPQRRG